MARRNEGVPFVATLGALTGVSATAVDISIPAQPAIVHEFAVEPGLGTWIVSAYFIGFGFGQFVWGPVSDRYGRLGSALRGHSALSWSPALSVP